MAAFDGHALIATARSIDLDLSVPGGGLVATRGITDVTVSATHRRTGLMTAIITGELGAARDRGQPLAAVVTSQWPLYERYGFGPAVFKTGIQAEARSLNFTTDLPGTVEYADAAALRQLSPALYERHRRRSAGAITRSEAFWDRQFATTDDQGGPPADHLYIVARDERAQATGYAVYKVAEHWSRAERPECTVTVVDMITDDALTQARLWKFLAQHDWVATITAGGQPVDAPWPMLLADARAVHYTHRLDSLWLRILDAPAALSQRRYEVPGRLVIRVVDQAGHADGTFALDAGAQDATCVATAQNPELTISVDVLARLYLGAESATRLAAVGIVTEHRHGALARAETMFRTARTPWRPTSF